MLQGMFTRSAPRPDHESTVGIRESTVGIRLFACGIVFAWLALSLAGPLSTAQEQDAARLRTWTDRSGKFSTRAELVGRDGDMIELRKDDGTLVKLALDRLSDADQTFLREQAAGLPAASPAASAAGAPKPLSLSRIRSSEQKLLYAKKIADAYRSLLAQPEITDSDRIAAERRLAEVEPEAARDALLIGKEFKLLDEVMAWKRESDQAIDTLVNGPSGKDGQEVLKLLKSLSRKDPVSCRANFLLGMGFAITARNFELALDEFQECVRRLEDFGSLATAAPDLALPAMYNNLALIQIRRGYLDAALKLWESAAGDSTALPAPLLENFTHQVIFINGAVASDGKNFFNNPEATLLTRYRKFAERVGVSESQIRAHTGHGWQYLNLQLREKDDDLGKIRVAMVDEACLNCNGSSVVKCRNCKGSGVVVGKLLEPQKLPTGHIMMHETSVKTPCSFCERGTFPCRACDDGVERLPR